MTHRRKMLAAFERAIERVLTKEKTYGFMKARGHRWKALISFCVTDTQQECNYYELNR